MFYKILQRTVRIYLRFYFKKLYFNRIDDIQDDTPVLIACNHNSAFAAALVLGSFLSKLEMHYIVRGDVFNPKMLWFFKLTNQIPIFRFRDGYGNMKKNNDTMTYCYEALSNKQRIIIFSEGDCSVKMRLRTIQKGTARMAFGAYEKYKMEDILIYPVGINYIEPTKMRSSVIVHSGDPIHVNQYYATYNENPNKAIKELTEEIQRRMVDQVLSIEDEQTHDEARKAIQYIDSSFMAPLLALKQNDSFFRHVQQWIQLHNEQIRSGNEEWATTLQSWVKNMKKHYIRTRLPLFLENLTTQSILCVILLPIGLPAVLYFGIPHWLSKALVKRMKVSPEFTNSIRIGSSFFFLIFQMLITFLIIGITIKWKFGLFFLILASLIAKIGQIWWHAFHYVLQRYNWHRMGESLQKVTISQLQKLHLSK